MQLTITPTSNIAKINSTHCLVWIGSTENGTKCYVLAVAPLTVRGVAAHSYPLKMVMCPTEISTQACGLNCREWKGMTDDGRECRLLIALVIAPPGSESEFHELEQLRVINPELN